MSRSDCGTVVNPDTVHAADATLSVAVGAQYDTAHV